MLIRILASITLLCLMTTAIPAAADPEEDTDESTPTPTVTTIYQSRELELALNTQSQANSDAGTSGGGGDSGPKCHYQGKPKPCKTGAGTWSNGMNCYYRPIDFYVEPAVLAQSEGTWVYCSEHGPDVMFTIGPEPETPPPDPQVLLQQAIERMQLEPIVLGTYPGTLELSKEAGTLVNWNMWLWVDQRTPNNWGPISRTVTLDGYSLTATAHAINVTWDMGNGDSFTCGVGNKWFKKYREENRKSPSCGYMYTKSGTYPITATSHWQIDWEGVGQSGSLTMDLAKTETMLVSEWRTFICAEDLDDC